MALLWLPVVIYTCFLNESTEIIKAVTTSTSVTNHASFMEQKMLNESEKYNS